MPQVRNCGFAILAALRFSVALVAKLGIAALLF